MFDNDTTLDLEQELSEIPPEYQDTFRQAIAQELAESEQNRTDNDMLLYLRQRRDDFKRGGFVRPDGRPGMVTLSPEALYEQALPELAQSSLGETDDTAEQRRTLMKVGIFVGAALLILFFVWRGRAQREKAASDGDDSTIAAEVDLNPTPVPTPSLPEITGVDDSLQTIGGLGGALTIGRPSAVELHYSRTEETIALAIDPSKPTPKGELRYNEAVMRSENPVAVWLFGTVLNYAVGLPDSLVRNLVPGDRITLSTDTGASLQFVVAETRTGTNYEASRLLSQNRIGLTLFALPALAADDVGYVLANYDVSGEAEQGQAVYEIGELFALGAVKDLQITGVQADHTTSGNLRVVVSGQSGVIDDQTIMLSLMAGREQTMAVELIIDETGEWETVFVLPGAVAGQPLLAEFRALPSVDLALVGLDDVPRLLEQLQVSVTGAVSDAASGEVVVTISIHNPAQGAVYLGPEYIQLLTEGGDVYALDGQIVPRLPTLIGSGETLGLMMTFLPVSASAQVRIGADLWELTGEVRSGISRVGETPKGVPPVGLLENSSLATPTSTGQLPATGGE